MYPAMTKGVLKSSTETEMKRISSGRLVDLALLGVVLIWSSSFIVVKKVLPQFNPLAFLFARIVLNTLVGIIFLWLKEGNFKIHRSDLPYFLVSGLFGYTFYQLGYILGLERTTAFSSAVLNCTMPLFSLLILTFFRLERITLYQWSGTLIGFAGVVWFVSEKVKGAQLTTAGWGDLLTIGAAFSFSIYSILNKSLITRYSSAKIMTYTLFFGAIFLIPAGLAPALEQNWSRISFSGWLGLVYTAIFPTYLAYSIWNWAISHQGVARTSLFTFLVPPLSGILAGWLLDETFSVVKLIGFGLVLGGLILTRISPGKFHH